MDRGVGSGFFVNDGSFMEKFKQLQQEKQEKEAASKEFKPDISRLHTHITKGTLDTNANENRKSNLSLSSGKLAFSLKQKSKLAAAPVKLGEDEDEYDSEPTRGHGDGSAKKQKLGQLEASESFSEQRFIAPSAPSDPAVRKVADKLAIFVAKNGRHFEHTTRQRNPGDTPFKFLFDLGCADYKYYEYRLAEEERLLTQTGYTQATRTASTSSMSSRASSGSDRSPHPQHSDYQIPASALYEADEDPRSSMASAHAASVGRAPSYGEYGGSLSASDAMAKMEFYMKKAAQEERKRQPKHSKDEMPPPASLQAPVKKGHHMGDYIPQEELEKFLSTCNDAAAQKAAKEAAERAKIQADNVGHKLLSKMGWREGEGLGSSKSGRSDPIVAGNVKVNNLGVGAEQPGEVTPDDDIYEQYKKRMMLGYRYRPNPLNNPRKAYY